MLPFSSMSAKAFFDAGEPAAALLSSGPPPSEAHTRVAEPLASTPVIFVFVPALLSSQSMCSGSYPETYLFIFSKLCL